MCHPHFRDLWYTTLPEDADSPYLREKKKEIKQTFPGYKSSVWEGANPTDKEQGIPSSLYWLGNIVNVNNEEMFLYVKF